MKNIAKVIIANLDPLDYLIPKDIDLEQGDLVIVPFRSKRMLAIIWQITSETECAIEKLKPIESKINFKISPLYIQFMEWIANYYLYNLGHVFKMLIPNEIGSYFVKGKEYKQKLLSKDYQYIKPSFNSEQINAIDKIDQFIIDGKNTIILDGVTGSGKTEVYLSIINSILISNSDAQVLIMLPEIALTNQIIDRVIKRLNYSPCIWHSSITAKQRRENFLNIINGSAKIIIGARSALFLPFKNLSLIIVDEEHEQSYKQEEGVAYQARDMSIMRAKLSNIPIILASASPSLESIHNIALGKLELVTLSGRYNANSMPKINILDMKLERRKKY